MKRTFHCYAKVKFKDATEDTLTVFRESADYIITRGSFEHRLISKRVTTMPKSLEAEISLVFGAEVMSYDYKGAGI